MKITKPSDWLKVPDDTKAVFTIFKKPGDFPNHYVVRKHVLSSSKVEATPEYALANTLAQARRIIPSGLSCIKRKQNDVPSLLELWI